MKINSYFIKRYFHFTVLGNQFGVVGHGCHFRILVDSWKLDWVSERKVNNEDCNTWSTFLESVSYTIDIQIGSLSICKYCAYSNS